MTGSDVEKGMAAFLASRRIMLAPMAGVSDIAMRTLSIEHGARLTCTEMVSAKGLGYANERTRHLIEPASVEEVVAVQLFGREPDTMASQARWVEERLGRRLACIDINMGCPARKVVSKGEGSALMCDPSTASTVISAVSQAVSVPTTVKFRRGFEMDDETAPAFALAAQEAGAAAVAVHGRFARQFYRGRADWGVIARVKDAVSIPVIGNGDIRGPEDVVRMRDETGCDAFMIGRAARGNPWIFERCAAALDGSPVPPEPTFAQRLDCARLHARLLEELDGGALIRMRRHACWYIQGMPGASDARRRINECACREDFDEVFQELEARLEAGVQAEEANV